MNLNKFKSFRRFKTLKTKFLNKFKIFFHEVKE